MKQRRKRLAAIVMAMGLGVGMPGGSWGTASAAEGPAEADIPPYAFPKATFAEQDVSIERVTAGVQMTEDALAPVRGFTGPTSMLADPQNPSVILAATADLRSRRCHLVRSTDAGLNWQILESSPSPEDYPSCTTNTAGTSQTRIAWGSDGALYYGMLGYGPGEGGRDRHISVVLAKSTDQGDTWSTTMVVDNRGVPEPAPNASGVTGLTVDTSGPEDVVYVAFSHGYTNLPPESPLNDSQVMVGISRDGGESFEEPLNLNDFVGSDLTRTIGGTTYPLIMSTSFGRPFVYAHDGVVLAVSDARTPFSAPDLPGDSYHAMPQLVARSTDQGRTWSMTALSPPIYTGTGAQTGMGWTPAGGPEGTFVLAYAATGEDAVSSGTADLVVQRSTDLGQTWSEPLAINDDDPAERFASFYPELSVSPNGRVDVVWQDNRDQSDFRINVRYTYSTDGGLTWANNVLVNDQPLDFNFGISFNSDVRQPPGVASANEYAAFGWADARLGDEVSQTQDNFGSIAQFSPISTGSTLLPIVAAVFGGLAVAGLALLVIQRQRRGRPQQGSPASAR